MGSIFSKPKVPDPPPVPDPEPMPDPAAETEAELIQRKRKIAKTRSNRRRTFLTGDVEPDSGSLGKKTLLGG